jgi:hypothetical protein
MSVLVNLLGIANKNIPCYNFTTYSLIKYISQEIHHNMFFEFFFLIFEVDCIKAAQSFLEKNHQMKIISKTL